MGGAEVRLVLTPHMDAEVIGMGGTIALLSKAGYDVVVAYLTDGAGAFEGHVPEGEERARYSGIRKEEARRALGVLGVRRPPVFLDFPDSRLDEFVPRAVDRVVELILETGAKVIYAPHPDEYHPDHRATNRIARLAAWKAMYLRGRWIEHLYEYEVWPPMRSFTDVVNITDYAELKKEALEVYAKGTMRHLSPDALLALNKYRAFWTDIHGFAEVFNDVNRWVLRKEPPV
jgi:LmbE family N-acetylglucosaminyl deacetylase